MSKPNNFFNKKNQYKNNNTSSIINNQPKHGKNEYSKFLGLLANESFKKEKREGKEKNKQEKEKNFMTSRQSIFTFDETEDEEPKEKNLEFSKFHFEKDLNEQSNKQIGKIKYESGKHIFNDKYANLENLNIETSWNFFGPTSNYLSDNKSVSEFIDIIHGVDIQYELEKNKNIKEQNIQEDYRVGFEHPKNHTICMYCGENIETYRHKVKTNSIGNYHIDCYFEI